MSLINLKGTSRLADVTCQHIDLSGNLDVSNNASVGGTFGVMGTTSFIGNVGMSGTLNVLNESTFGGMITGNIIGNAATVTNGVYTSGDQTIGGVKTFSSTISGSISGNAGTVTNGVYTAGTQTIDGVKTFSSTISGSVTGNAGTVTNGVYTSGDQTIDGNKIISGKLLFVSSSGTLEMRHYNLSNNAPSIVIGKAGSDNILQISTWGVRRTLYISHPTQYAASETYKLDVNGAIKCSSILTSSDDRLKHNEKDISNCLYVLRKLKPRIYDKTLVMKDICYNGIIDEENVRECGFIAQEILKIDELKDFVKGGDYLDESYNLIKSAYSFDYNSLFTYGMGAIQELDIKYQQLEEKYQQL